MKNRKVLQRAIFQTVEALESRQMLAASYAQLAGSPFEAYPSSSGSQFEANVAYRNGTGVLTWTDDDAPGGNGLDVMARIIDDSGSFTGAAFRVNSGVVADQMSSRVGVADDGSFVIGWWDGNATAIKFQRYDALGVSNGGEITFSNSDLANMGEIAVAADGSFVVAYERWGLGGLDIQVAFQRFNAGGAAVGGIIEANTTLLGFQQNASIAINSTGGFVVAWSGQGSGDLLGGVFMQRYDASANPIGGEVLINTTTTGSQVDPDVGILSDDSIVITWYGEGSGDAEGIYFQRFNSAGSTLGSETLANASTTGAQRYPAIGVNSDDRFSVGWNDLGSGQATVRVFNSDGSAYSDELRGANGADNQTVSVGITDTNHVSVAYSLSAGSHTFMASFAPGLIINGTSSDDTITLADSSGDLAVTINGVTTTYSDFSNGVTVVGGLGSDTIIVSSLPAGLDGVTINGESGADSLVGSGGDDEILGGDGADTISGGFGADTLSGGAENDMLLGGGDADNISGNDGDDTIDGGAGADSLSGGNGIDTITYSLRTVAVSVSLDGMSNDGALNEGDNVDQSADVLVGGSGNDTLDAGDSNTSMTLRGNGGDDILTGGSFSDGLDGGAGNDTLDGGSGADELDGGDGTDTATYTSRSAAVRVVLDGNNGDGEANENDNVFTTVETVVGGGGDDTMVASAAGHMLLGGIGNDSLTGGVGNDSLFGGAGMDELRGISGNDCLVGGVERDRLIGGVGSDTLEGGEGPDVVYGQEGDDSIVGGFGRDRVWGGEGNDRIKGDHHEDTIYGEGGADRIYGDHGNDFLDGGQGEDYVQGGIGNDHLFGGTEYDKLFGEEGNDIFDGGVGHDRIDGGSGVDSSVIDLVDRLLGIETRV